jgi:hypothetical protein
LQALDKSLDFIIDTASGEHPFDPYITTLKTAGVLALVGAPSEMKLTPLKLLLGKVIYIRKKMQGNVSLSVRILISLIWVCIFPYCGRYDIHFWKCNRRHKTYTGNAGLLWYSQNLPQSRSHTNSVCE